MPAEYSSFVRNWFVSDDGKVDPSKLSVEDKMGDVLGNDEINRIIKNAAGGSSNLCIYIAIGLVMSIYRCSQRGEVTNFRYNRISTPFN